MRVTGTVRLVVDDVNPRIMPVQYSILNIRVLDVRVRHRTVRLVDDVSPDNACPSGSGTRVALYAYRYLIRLREEGKKEASKESADHTLCIV